MSSHNSISPVKKGETLKETERLTALFGALLILPLVSDE